jgi:hypothetical protein
MGLVPLDACHRPSDGLRRRRSLIRNCRASARLPLRTRNVEAKSPRRERDFISPTGLVDGRSADSRSDARGSDARAFFASHGVHRGSASRHGPAPSTRGRSTTFEGPSVPSQ